MMEERRGKIFGDPVDMTDSHRMTSWSWMKLVRMMKMTL
jgi:hypothetical protein